VGAGSRIEHLPICNLMESARLGRRWDTPTPPQRRLGAWHSACQNSASPRINDGLLLVQTRQESVMTSIASEMKRPALWTPGDWNAFFGFGTNILVNMLVLTGLLRFVLKMPDSLVFGRILPALGLMMCLSTMYYAFLAYRLALKTGRGDVCALPSGVSVPHMFIVTFVIMLPITLKTNDPIK
jgi:hypothetical protein